MRRCTWRSVCGTHGTCAPGAQSAAPAASVALVAPVAPGAQSVGRSFCGTCRRQAALVARVPDSCAVPIRCIELQGPFTYEALPPEDISFVPLKQTQQFNARDLLQVRQRCVQVLAL